MLTRVSLKYLKIRKHYNDPRTTWMEDLLIGMALITLKHHLWESILEINLQCL